MTENRSSQFEERYQAILEFINKMELVSQFQSKVDVTHNIDEIWKIFLGDIRESIPVAVCALFLNDEDRKAFVLKEVSPFEEDALCRREIGLQQESGMFSWVINQRRPMLIPSEVPREDRTLIMLPLSTARRTLGVVMLYTTIEESAITQENLKLLTMLAKQCSLVMENTLLYEKLANEHESLKRAQAQILRIEKLASMGKLTAGASHEILNPLNIISGRIQLLLMDETDDPELTRHLSIMLEQSNRISKIVKSLLQFSSSSEPTMKAVEINDLVEKVFSMKKHEINPDNLKVIKSLTPNLPPVRGDERGLFKVVLNLLSNAFEAMPVGGTLEIATRQIEPDEKIDLETEGSCIEIEIKDTGTGIAAENVNRVFDPFFTTKEDQNATGLGLAIAFGIVNNHGGSIRLDNRPNKGTRARVVLPVYRKIN